MIGHIKVRVATARGCAKGSIVSTTHPSRDESDPSVSDRATALVNARVGAAPEQLDAMIGDAVAAADASCASRSIRLRGEVFRPGFPVPRYRM